ncbi:uncharacterized protein [Macrobrachium rosenbergii]|uniref:uncharacterized protein n=1 Tax=Macrobrachium rosenbergii TaxID=79674 RepID=UPI0034D73634
MLSVALRKIKESISPPCRKFDGARNKMSWETVWKNRSLIKVLFFLVKILGGFPYCWKTKRYFSQVTRSIVTTVWSFILLVILSTFSLSSILHAPKSDNEGLTAEVTGYILSYGTYGTMLLFFPCFVLRSFCLADAVNTMTENRVLLIRRILTGKDKPQIMYITGSVIALGFINYTAIRLCLERRRIAYYVTSSMCDFINEAIVMTVSLLLYSLVKVLSLEALEVVDSLCEKFRREDASQMEEGSECHVLTISQGIPNGSPTVPHTCIFPGSRSHHGKPSVIQTAVTGQEGSNVYTTDRDYCRGVSRRLMVLDEILLKVMDYMGPLVALIFFSSFLNVTTMLYQAIVNMNTYYVAYITLKILSVINISCITDSLWWKRESCLRQVRRLLNASNLTSSQEAGLNDVERALLNSPEFHICHLFTLNRGIILPVSVRTSLIISLLPDDSRWRMP